MNKVTNKQTINRNLSLCPITPDPLELMELIAELKNYLKTIDFQNDSIYKAHYTFDYNGVTYRMDHSVLATSPAILWKANFHITEQLHKLGASNVHLRVRSD